MDAVQLGKRAPWEAATAEQGLLLHTGATHDHPRSNPGSAARQRIQLLFNQDATVLAFGLEPELSVSGVPSCLARTWYRAHDIVQAAGTSLSITAVRRLGLKKKDATMRWAVLTYAWPCRMMESTLPNRTHQLYVRATIHLAVLLCFIKV